MVGCCFVFSLKCIGCCLIAVIYMYKKGFGYYVYYCVDGLKNRLYNTIGCKLEKMLYVFGYTFLNLYVYKKFL